MKQDGIDENQHLVELEMISQETNVGEEDKNFWEMNFIKQDCSWSSYGIRNHPKSNF